MSTQLEVVDTVPAFLDFFPAVAHLAIARQTEAWEKRYMSQWPELFQKQKACYAEEGEAWEAMARKYISLRPFFGSWYDLQGYKQTGYYLGHEIVRRLEQERSLQDIALLGDIEGAVRPVLERVSN